MIKDNAERRKIWNCLISMGCTEYGAAGMMGNMYAESGLIANRLEILCRKRLREAGKGEWSDEAYTAAVDNGTISENEFLHPLPGKQYGYGLCQWTSPGRKALLYNTAHRMGASVGDVTVQMEVLKSELTNTYKKTFAVLKSAQDIATASDYVLIHFEAPANAEAAKATRRSYATEIFKLYHGGNKTMTEQEQRQAVVNWLVARKGIREGSAEHKALLKVFNDSGLCKRYKMTVNDPWCATAASAAYIANGLGSIFPVECSCNYIIKYAQERGIWVENDAYRPNIADAVLYDWDDNGVGDNRGSAEHIGLVLSVSGNSMVIIEGNKNNTVATRNLAINGRYIRGFVTPKFTGTKTTTPTTPSKPSTPSAPAVTKKVTASKAAQKFDKSIAGTYVTTAALNLRDGAGKDTNKSLVVLDKGTKVRNYGYYSMANGVKWFYVQVTFKGVTYTGFCSSAYLRR